MYINPFEDLLGLLSESLEGLFIGNVSLGGRNHVLKILMLEIAPTSPTFCREGHFPYLAKFSLVIKM